MELSAKQNRRFRLGAIKKPTKTDLRQQWTDDIALEV